MRALGVIRRGRCAWLSLVCSVACAAAGPGRSPGDDRRASVSRVAQGAPQESRVSWSWRHEWATKAGRGVCAAALTPDGLGGVYALAPFFGELASHGKTLTSELSRYALLHLSASGELDRAELLPAELRSVLTTGVFANDLYVVAELAGGGIELLRLSAGGKLLSQTPLDLSPPLAVRLVGPGELLAISSSNGLSRRLSFLQAGRPRWRSRLHEMSGQCHRRSAMTADLRWWGQSMRWPTRHWKRACRFCGKPMACSSTR